MQLLNYFKKLITGYFTVYKKVNGLDFRYSYSGKPVFFDPFSMLEQYKQRSGNESIQGLRLAGARAEPFPDFVYPADGDLPSVICEGVKDGHEFKTERYTFKDGIYSVSFYRFELDGNLAGTFRRQYDYGSQLQKFAVIIASLNQSDLNPDKENWLWRGSRGEEIFLEKFGHSQLWNILNPKILEL
jgi:hypothetical protein